MEAARHVNLVDTETGEVTDLPTVKTLQARLEEQVQQNEMLERDLRGKRLQMGRLEKELADVAGAEPGAENVRQALDYWARRVVEEGWWSRKPTFRPGDERWQATGARLKDGKAIDYLCMAVEGALLQGKQTKRAWIDATSIFRNNKNLEQHYERAADVDLERVRVQRALPYELQRMSNAELARLAERCDTCGHLGLDHVPLSHHIERMVELTGWQLKADTLSPCSHCPCPSFEFYGEAR